MRHWTPLAALVAIATTTAPAFAAPAATQDQADKLKAVFERYVGRSAAGEPDKVSVVPEGQSYRVSYDYQQLARPLESFGLRVEAASQTLRLTPNDDGTWHVTSDAMPPIVIHIKDQTVSLANSTYRYDGVFDPKLGVFTDQTTTEDGSTYDQDAPAMLQHRRTGHSVTTWTSRPAETGSVNIDARYALSDLTALMTGHPPAAAGAADAPAPAPFELSYTLPKLNLGVGINRLLATRLLDLWAFFVAHPNREAIVAAQDELRRLVLAALPLPSSLTEQVSVETPSAKTPIGPLSAGAVKVSLDAGDLGGTGKLSMVYAVDRLAVPTADLPAWAANFVPTGVDLRPSLVGFHADEAAREAATGFDLSIPDLFRPEQRDKISHIFWPGDGKVVLAPSRITSAVLDIKAEGEATISAAPVGRITLSAAGLDKAIGLLQAAAGSDPTAAQALTGLVTAKNLAKPNPDGTLGWVIEATAGAPVTVNGVPLQ